jgi:predicted phosphohydrolase
MAAFLVRALDLTEGAGSDDFTDDDDSIFEADIERLAAAGITKGCNPPSNSRFCPNDSVTRGQMAAFLVRALDLTEGAGSDDFTDDDDSIFEADIERLAAAGITKGCNPPSNSRFCPDSRLTRGQMAAFLRRAIG